MKRNGAYAIERAIDFTEYFIHPPPPPPSFSRVIDKCSCIIGNRVRLRSKSLVQFEFVKILVKYSAKFIYSSRFRLYLLLERILICKSPSCLDDKSFSSCDNRDSIESIIEFCPVVSCQFNFVILRILRRDVSLLRHLDESFLYH